MGAPVQKELSRLGRYDVLGLLATGGMAEIFLARQEGPAGFERPVVVKRVLPHLARQRVFHDMFLDEARIVSRIRHPNVVNVHELGDDNSELFLVMEYLEGESLATVVKRLRRNAELLPLRMAVHIISEACAGLHAAHELEGDDGKKLDIVHRDVSPQNLFVLYAGQVKVIDFGIAKALDRTASRTQTGQVKGKFAYMAPEQIGAQPIDRRADIFALGAVLHELITGQKLFGRDHDLLVLKAVCEEPIAPPSASREGVPKMLDDIVMRALSRHKAGRYESAAAMRRDLSLALRDLGGDDLPEEALASLMGRLFVERVARHHDLMKRFRTGQVITQVPSAETTTEVTPATLAEPSSRTGIVSPGQVVSVVQAAPKNRSIGGVALGVLAIVVVAGAVVGAWAMHRATRLPTAALATQPADVTIQVTSNPSGAHVAIDGVDRGTTPVDIRLPHSDVAVDVRVTRDAYVPTEQTLVPSSDQKLMVTLSAASNGLPLEVAQPQAAQTGTATAPDSSSDPKAAVPPANRTNQTPAARAPAAKAHPAAPGFMRFD